MEILPKKVLIPVIFGIVIWILAFFIIGWTQISEDPAIQELYFPLVILFGVGTVLLMVVLLWWYLPHFNIDLKQKWFQESVLFGLVVMVVQYLLDISVFTLMQVDLIVYFFGIFSGDPDGSTVMIVYPLILIWAVLGGFITMRTKT
jgi:hypothetical protein